MKKSKKNKRSSGSKSAGKQAGKSKSSKGTQNRKDGKVSRSNLKKVMGLELLLGSLEGVAFGGGGPCY